MPTERDTSRAIRRGTLRRRVARIGLGVLVLALVAGAGWWAGRQTVTAPPEVDASASQRVTVGVVEGTIGRELALTATITQPFVQVAANGLTGIVTAVNSGSIDVGDVVYAVSGQPVFAMPGRIPFYRDLAVGVRGDDVAQLQSGLNRLGYNLDDDGVFGAQTAAAVRQWQRDVGMPVTGVVEWTRLVAIPSLPDTVRLGEQIVVSGHVSGGEAAVLARTAEPLFALILMPEQASQIPDGADVAVIAGDERWAAVAGTRSVDENQQTAIALTTADGEPPCEACDGLPAEERITVPALVTIVPEVSGPIVPVSAITTDAAGTAWVELADGTTVEVEVVATQDGSAVVNGIEAGSEVVAVAEE